MSWCECLSRGRASGKWASSAVWSTALRPGGLGSGHSEEEHLGEWAEPGQGAGHTHMEKWSQEKQRVGYTQKGVSKVHIRKGRSGSSSQRRDIHMEKERNLK